jgi:hypothetical protein
MEKMNEEIKVCYLAFLKTENIVDCKAASYELRGLTIMAEIAEHLTAFNNVIINSWVKKESVVKAEDMIRHYHVIFGNK